jgi:hypothetical protein
MINGSPNSVIDFGAVGDGSTDNSSAIQAALTASEEKTLIFPPGVYLVNGAGLTVPSNITIQGYGATVKTSTTPTANLFNATSKQNIVLEGIIIDANNYVVASNISLFNFFLCSSINIFNCQFINIDRFGISFNACSDVTIENNYISKTTAATSQNQAINVSSAGGECANFKISGNRLVKSGIDVSITRSEISKNVISDWKFGAGITTEQDPLCNTIIISKNICYGGAAIDVNGFRCAGIENWAAFSVIEGNICFSNYGSGIDQGSLKSTIVGNVFFNNGLSGGGSGIVARYGTALYNTSESVFSGNRCFDTNGAGGSQEYGYQEQSALLTDIVLSGNSFQQNKTGQILILSASTSYSGNSTTYSTTFNPPSLIAGEFNLSSYTVAGARVGDLVSVSFSLDAQGILFYGYVTVNNTVAVGLKNNTLGTIDLASGTLVIRCQRTSVNQNSY